MPGDFPVHLHFLMPQRPLEKDSWAYDIKCSPMDDLPCMAYTLAFVESQGETVLFHLVPQRSKLVPGYVWFDTKTFLTLFGWVSLKKEYDSSGKKPQCPRRIQKVTYRKIVEI
jgi:hypothetical protein